MPRRLIRPILASLLAASAVATPVAADPVESPVAEWNRHAATALMNPASPTPPALPGAGYGPTVAVLHMAMVHGAVYDAVNSIVGGYEPYLSGIQPAPESASQAAAVATAAHHVLVGFEPSLAPAVEDWVNREYRESLAAIANGRSKGTGIAAGARAAEAMLAARADDGRFVPFSFSQGTDVGEWRPTGSGSDPSAWVARVDPFLLNSTSQLRSDGPLRITSPEYAVEFNEVKELGRLTGSSRTPEQEALALFYVPSPVEMFNRNFREIASNQGLDLAEQARLFAMLNLAGADGLISCWDDKEFWSFWRPDTAIQFGGSDGNSATAGETGWTPLRPNPPYPEHPSGYNCLTSSMMNTAVSFFGTDDVPFTIRQTAAASSPTRNYGHFTDVVKDTINSRLYLGIHFRTGNVQGATIGEEVADWLDARFFLPTD
jgi:hypothetical protein